MNKFHVTLKCPVVGHVTVTYSLNPEKIVSIKMVDDGRMNAHLFQDSANQGLSTSVEEFNRCFPLVYHYLANFGEDNIPSSVFDLLDFSDRSEFTKRIYRALFDVKVGKITTYKQLAKAAGNQKAPRAVGNAMASNRHVLIVPCHRVVKSDSIGNFAVNPEFKKELLIRENAFTSEELNTMQNSSAKARQLIANKMP